MRVEELGVRARDVRPGAFEWPLDGFDDSTNGNTTALLKKAFPRKRASLPSPAICVCPGTSYTRRP